MKKRILAVLVMVLLLAGTARATEYFDIDLNRIMIARVFYVGNLEPIQARILTPSNSVDVEVEVWDGYLEGSTLAEYSFYSNDDSLHIIDINRTAWDEFVTVVVSFYSYDGDIILPVESVYDEHDSYWLNECCWDDLDMNAIWCSDGNCIDSRDPWNASISLVVEDDDYYDDNDYHHHHSSSVSSCFISSLFGKIKILKKSRAVFWSCFLR